MFDKQVALSISQHADLGIARLLKRQLGGKSAPGSLKLGGGDSAPAVPHPPTAAIARTPGEFVNRVMPSIRRASLRLGLDPSGMLAQAALETGWGQRMPLNADGSPSHNLFGIKAGEGWSGAKATADTIEVVDGVASPRRVARQAHQDLHRLRGRRLDGCGRAAHLARTRREARPAHHHREQARRRGRFRGAPPDSAHAPQTRADGSHPAAHSRPGAAPAAGAGNRTRRAAAPRRCRRPPRSPRRRRCRRRRWWPRRTPRRGPVRHP